MGSTDLICFSRRRKQQVQRQAASWPAPNPPQEVPAHHRLFPECRLGQACLHVSLRMLRGVAPQLKGVSLRLRGKKVLFCYGIICQTGEETRPAVCSISAVSSLVNITGLLIPSNDRKPGSAYSPPPRHRNYCLYSQPFIIFYTVIASTL